MHKDVCANAQGCLCIRVGGCTRLTQMSPGEGFENSEGYLCLQRRENCLAPCCVNRNGSESSSGLCTVKSCRCRTAHKGERRAIWNQWTGLPDWDTGLDCWNGLNCCKKPFSWYNSFLESSHSVTLLTCSMPFLGILPRRLGGQRLYCIFNYVALTERLELGYVKRELSGTVLC